MAIVKLGQRPKTFKVMTVKFQMPDGTEGEIPVTFKYHTRIEYGELVDGIFKDAGKKRPEGEGFSMRELMEATRDKNGDYLIKILDSWGLEDALTVENLRQLCAELPAGATAMMDAFRTAAMEGRLGN